MQRVVTDHFYSALSSDRLCRYSVMFVMGVSPGRINDLYIAPVEEDQFQYAVSLILCRHFKIKINPVRFLKRIDDITQSSE